jgi:hypothetical protein
MKSPDDDDSTDVKVIKISEKAFSGAVGLDSRALQMCPAFQCLEMRCGRQVNNR